MFLGWVYRVALATVVISATGAAGWYALAVNRGPPQLQISATGVLPGEFERQDGLLLAWHPAIKVAAVRPLIDVIEAVHLRTRVLLLVPDESFKKWALSLLLARGVGPERVEFIVCDINFPWARDFGPLMIKRFDGEVEVLDLQYSDPCNRVPRIIANRESLDCEYVPLMLENGNLLSNGVGLSVSTTKILPHNEDQFAHSSKDVYRLLQRHLGIQTLVLLEPLAGELTGHVDMFATFTAPDTIVVAEIDAEDDPENAAILNRNADRLRGLATPSGPLRVARIPMPPPGAEGRFYSMTNVVYANGLLLMPVYEEVDDGLEREALRVYRQLLPQWEIRTIECGGLLDIHGALHCATMSLLKLKEREPPVPQLATEGA